MNAPGRATYSTSEIPGLNPLQSRRKRPRTLEFVYVLAACLLAGEVGLAVPFTSGNVSPLWPPAGVALAAMLLFGYHIWPAVALGALIVNFLSGVPHLAAVGIALGNTVGPLCGTWFLRQLPRFRPSLTRLRDVLGIGILGGFCGTAVSATVGAGVLFLTGINAWFGFASAWLIWWLGDAMGVLIITPLVLTFTSLMSTRENRRLVELACLLLGAVGSALLIFDPRLGLMRADVFAFGVFPFVLWGAIRFEAAGAAIVSFLISAIAVWGTAHGVGPFIKGNPLQNATLLQSFLGVTAVSGMVLAAVIAERAQLIREQSAQEALEQELQLRLGREVQQRFYTGTAICVAGFDIASAAYPARETGGDYLDLFSMADGRICIGVGDVSGHGLGSALVMALTRAYVRSFSQVETDLAKILSSVNHMLIADHLEDDRFVTLLLVCLDGPNGSLSYASAGHVPGFLMNGSGKIESVLESSGPPLGLFDDSQFVTSALPLTPQQLVILLTDGAPETMASEDVEFGTDGVLEYVRDHRHDSARDLAEGIYRAARAFAGDEPQRDDVTDVIVKIS